MQKKIIASIVAILLGTSSPAFADATVVIPGFTEISYPSEVKIGSSGCKTIKFAYVNDEDLVQENSVFLIQILHKTKKVTHGFGAWFSTMTANPSSVDLGPLPRAGIIPIKLCKKKWTSGTGSNKATLAATPPGTYRIYFTAGFVDAVTGAPLPGKIEIFKTLKVS
jgi:hypothetical protein